jgi:uncharacterized protein (UPF0548 family)
MDMTPSEGRGLTMPAKQAWGTTPGGYLRAERSADVGSGEAAWAAASAALLEWGVKTRSGFSVTPPGPAVAGARPTIVVRALGVTVREPVEVLEVAHTPLRVALAYRTLPGHPVRGEEAFILHRGAPGEEFSLTLRSLTRPSDRWWWALAFPALLVAQAVVRRRYFRALREG